MRLRYFALIRQRLGLAEEEVTVPQGVVDVAGLLDWLRQRDEGFAAILDPENPVKVSVNLAYAELTTKVEDGDEIGIFPPVTGG